MQLKEDCRVLFSSVYVHVDNIILSTNHAPCTHKDLKMNDIMINMREYKEDNNLII